MSVHFPVCGLPDALRGHETPFDCRVRGNFGIITGLYRTGPGGFNGYWLQQLTDDKANDINIPHSLERTVGLCAGIQALSGHTSWFHLNGLRETDVRNRPQGFSVTFRYTKAFPSSSSAQ
jgi:hypothetical protein